MTRLFWLATFIAILSTSLLIGEWALNETLKAENEGLKTHFTSTMEVKKASTGAEMAKVPVAEVGQQTLQELIDARIDTLEQVFGKKLSRIEQYERVQIETQNRLKLAGKPVKSGKDSTILMVFHYQDKWMERNDTLEGDTLRTGTDFRNDLQIVVRKDKRTKWWQVWKKRRLVGEVYSGNPQTEIKDFQILKLIDK